jgi:hypothetical protein
MPYGGRGYRRMYYATGLPGWLRFGYSPGWGGMPLGAQYIMQSGQLPQFLSFLQQQRMPVTGGGVGGISFPAQQKPAMEIPKEQELNLLEQQANILEKQLEEIRKRIEELKK